MGGINKIDVGSLPAKRVLPASGSRQCRRRLPGVAVYLLATGCLPHPERRL